MLLLTWVGLSTTTSATGTGLRNGSLEKHDKDLRVGLNCRVYVWLLLLEILHEHGSEILVSQKPLTNSWEARI